MSQNERVDDRLSYFGGITCLAGLEILQLIEV